VGINIRRDVGRARNKWQFIRIDRSLLRYKNKSISSQITAFGRPLCRLSTGECHLTGYLVCTNTLCSIIRSLYAAVSVSFLVRLALLSTCFLTAYDSGKLVSSSRGRFLRLVGVLRSSQILLPSSLILYIFLDNRLGLGVSSIASKGFSSLNSRNTIF
jgi:hypothetical protein